MSEHDHGIGPGQHPGGIVLHTHAVTGECLVVQKVSDPMASKMMAIAAADAARSDPRSRSGLILFCFDGDSGDWFAHPVLALGPG